MSLGTNWFQVPSSSTWPGASGFFGISLLPGGCSSPLATTGLVEPSRPYLIRCAILGRTDLLRKLRCGDRSGLSTNKSGKNSRPGSRHHVELPSLACRRSPPKVHYQALCQKPWSESEASSQKRHGGSGSRGLRPVKRISPCSRAIEFGPSDPWNRSGTIQAWTQRLRVKEQSVESPGGQSGRMGREKDGHSCYDLINEVWLSVRLPGDRGCCLPTRWFTASRPCGSSGKRGR